MKIAKIILSVFTLGAAILGLFKFIPFTITNPVLFFSLATYLVLKGIESRRNRDTTGAILMFLTALALYAVSIYRLYTGLGAG